GIRAFHVTGVQTCALPISIELDREKPITPLLPFENDVLNYLKAAARPGAANRLSSFELKSYSQRNGATFVTKWGQSVRKWLEATSEERRVGRGRPSQGTAA